MGFASYNEDIIDRWNESGSYEQSLDTTRARSSSDGPEVHSARIDRSAQHVERQSSDLEVARLLELLELLELRSPQCRRRKGSR
jgi:hypothetical protein